MSLPRYPEYKDSGVIWAGEVPTQWNVLPLLGVAQERCESNSGMKEGNLLSLSYGNIVRRDASSNDGLLPESYETYQVVYPSDIVFRLTDLQNDKRSLRTALVPERGIITSAYLAVMPRSIDARYFAYLLRFYDLTKVFYSMGGGLRQSMKYDDVKRLPVLVPSSSEQLAVAAFLDRETAKIDALIAEQERLLALLAEKRQATISDAVTRGLNPNAPMKDSGIPWLGEVPAHWSLGGLTKFIGPVVDYRGRTPTKGDEGVFLVTAKNIRDGAIDYEASQEYVDPNEAEALLSRGRPEVGDVLFTTEAPLGQVAQIDRTDVALAQRVVKFRGLGGVLTNRYLMYWLMGSACQSRLETLATGSTALGIKASKLGMIECLVPPVDEQERIVAHIDKQLRQFGVLRDEAARGIELLRERRSAMISAAVTGKIDVQWAVSLGSKSEVAA